MRLFRVVLIFLALLAAAALAAPQPQKQVLRPEGFQPRFPSSPGVIARELVWVAGQGSRDPRTGQHPATFEDQVRQAIENVRIVLQAGHLDLSHAVSCHVYLDDLENYGRMNAVYGKLFTESPPVRTTIAVPALPDDSHLEVTCIAARDKASKKAVFRGGTPPARPGLFPNGMRIGDWLFTSGVGSRNPATGRHPEGFEAQVKQVMETLGAVLQAGGVGFSEVVWANLYVDDAQNVPVMEKVYDGYFTGARKPGRTVSIVSRIPGDSHVEITLLAQVGHEPGPAAAPGLGPRVIGKNAGVLAGHTLFLSAHSSGGRTVEDQVKGTLKKLKKALGAAGMNFSHVVKAHVYLKDLADFPRMNAVYRAHFPRDPPARTTVQIKQPGSAPEGLVEISFVAVK